MSIKFIVENKVFIVDRRIMQTSEFLQEVIGDEDFEMTIENPIVSAKSFETILDYYQFNNFNPKIIEQIDLNPDVCFLNLHDKELILRYDVFEGNELRDLLNAAIYLQMKAFRKLCLARIAFEFALDYRNQNQRFSELKQKFNFQNMTLCYNEVEKQRKSYPHLTYQFQ